MWIDGRIAPASEFRLDPEDEGLLYGRGVFTTTRTHGGTPWLWERHLLRVADSARRIGVVIDVTDFPTVSEVRRFVDETGGRDCVVRLNLSASGRMWMIRRELPEPKDSLRLSVSAYQVWPGERLASLKSFNYLARHLAFKDAWDRGYDDAILCDPDSRVLEAAHSNVFARFGTRWRTPPLTGGVLPGVVRDLLLSENEGGIDELPIPLQEFLDADEIAVTNSVRGVVSVSQIDGQEFATTQAVRALAPSSYV